MTFQFPTEPQTPHARRTRPRLVDQIEGWLLDLRLTDARRHLHAIQTRRRVLRTSTKGLAMADPKPPVPPSPEQLRLPFDAPHCPRCTTEAPIEYDREYDLWVCSGCAQTWRIPADEAGR